MATLGHMQFGRQIVFTYGPFGFLDSSNTYADHRLWIISLTFSYLLHMIFVTAVFFFAGRYKPKTTARRLLAALIFALVMIPAAPVIPNDDKLLFVAVIALSFAFSGSGGIQSYSTCSVAAVSLGLVSLMKFSSAIIAVSVILSFVVLQATRHRWSHGLFLFGLWFFAYLLGWVIAGQELGNLWHFWAYGVQFVTGYGGAMGVPGSPDETFIGILGVIGVTGLLVYCVATNRGPVFVFLVLTWMFYFSMFRLGFTRHGIHAWVYFSSSVVYWLILLTIILQENSRHRRTLTLAAFILMSLHGVWQYRSYQKYAGLRIPPGLWAQRSSLGDAWRLMTDASFRPRYIARAKEKLLSVYELKPGEVKSLVGSESVEVFPFDIAIAWAEDLKWTPRPVFQSYLAYTPALDALNASHFRGARAPRWVLWRWRSHSIDGRYALFDEPETFRSLLCSYEFATRIGDLIFLKHKENSCGPSTAITSVSSELGKPIEIPSYQDGLLFARVATHERVVARLKGLILRPGQLQIEFPEKAGTGYRLIRAVSGDGLFAGAEPETSEDFIELFSGTIHRDVSVFSIRQRLERWDFANWGDDYTPEVNVEYFGVRSPTRVLQKSDVIEKGPEWRSMHKLPGGQGGIDFKTNPLFHRSNSGQWEVDAHLFQYFRLQGWATGDQYNSATYQIYLVLENDTGKAVLLANSQPRRDVAHYLNLPEDRVGGFNATLWIGDIPEGCYRTSVRLLSPAANNFYEIRSNMLCISRR